MNESYGKNAFGHMADDYIFKEVSEERDRQRQMNWGDEKNASQEQFSALIGNYTTRWALQHHFPYKTFRECMVQVAALAFAAIEWEDNRDTE